MKMLLKRVYVLLILIFLLGCTLPSPTPPGTPSCPIDQLTSPALSSPAMWAIVPTFNPTLSWAANDPSIPYPYDICEPDGYRVRLRQGPYFSTDLDTVSSSPFIGPSIRNWTPFTPLLPGHAYEWSVAAHTSGTNGPFADSRYFFTGPVCDTGALRDPRLLQPANGAMVNTLEPLLVWEYKDPCIPQGYRIDLSTDPSFADTSLSGGTGNPSTRWFPGVDLTDCTWYYWRVAPINDTTLGPFSGTRSFMVNVSGSCAYPLPGLAPTLVTFPTVPPGLPRFTLDQNANCRIGPGVVFEARRSYLKGEILEVAGINDLGTWLYVKMPKEGENFCWVSLITGALDIDPNLIPTKESPPTPMPTVVPQNNNNPPQYNSCQDYPSQDICKMDPNHFGSCYWSQNNSCVSGKP